ncbi:MAG: hypothetical protein HDT44_01100 [Ruminococcaceae bacterium]|nr:hypothetical protein [Oscillospiraceae bacterium]
MEYHLILPTSDKVCSLNLSSVSAVSNSIAETSSPEVTEETTVSDFETDVITRLDTIIDGLQGIFNALWLFIGIVVVGIVINFLWTIIAKWFFGGI